MNFKHSLIISFYNNEPFIDELHERLKKVMETLDGPVEYCYVDDGSKDRTYQKLLDLNRCEPGVSVIKLSRNFGHHKALWAGMSAASGEVCIMMDGDLQDQPEEIPRLLGKINEGFDIVYAIREERTEPFFRRFASSLFWDLINSISQHRCPPNQAVLRAFTKKVRDELIRLNEVHLFLAGLFAWVGFSQTEIKIRQQKRKYGKTSYTLKKILSQVLDAVLPFSSKPLRLISFLGMICSICSFLFAVYFASIRLISGQGIQGWTSIIVTIFFATGLILLCLGIVAEYLGRLYQQSLNRPPFIVETYLSGKDFCDE